MCTFLQIRIPLLRVIALNDLRYLVYHDAADFLVIYLCVLSTDHSGSIFGVS
jgi:hypothetical protein